MSAYSVLPDGYEEKMVVDLQKDTKTAGKVNGLSLILAVLLILPGHRIVPVPHALELFRVLHGAVLLAGMIAYILLHELVHGIAMYLYSRQKPFYGFTAMYAYAGSSCYFARTGYIVIALAPIVLLGIVLLLLNLLLGEEWFWVVYLIQIINLSGAAGDLYVTRLFSKMPEDILIHDIGVRMTVYSRKQ